VNDPKSPNPSRRQFLRRCGGMAAVPVCANFAAGQNDASGRLEITMVRAFSGAQFRGVSPDGTRLSLYRLRHVETRLRSWSYDGGESKKSDDVLQVVEIETGKVVYATQLRTMVVGLSFFAGAERLYAETMPLATADSGRFNVVQQVVIDLETRELAERLNQGQDLYIALTGGSLLGYRISQAAYSIRRATEPPSALWLAALPDYRETARAAFATTSEPERYGRPRAFGGAMHWGYDTTPVVSLDKSIVVYGAGHYLVCRRTTDLQILWTQLIEPEYFGVWQVAVTPDGTSVAAAVIAGPAVDNDKSYIGVYRGGDGFVLAKLPLNGFDGVSISPDGKLLAVSAQTPVPGGLEPSVVLYEIASGAQAGKVSHAPVNVSGFGNSGRAGIGGEFTPDGRYLITSGFRDTKVWLVRPQGVFRAAPRPELRPAAGSNPLNHVKGNPRRPCRPPSSSPA
jgi:hypothetical protein